MKSSICASLDSLRAPALTFFIIAVFAPLVKPFFVKRREIVEVPEKNLTNDTKRRNMYHVKTCARGSVWANGRVGREAAP